MPSKRGVIVFGVPEQAEAEYNALAKEYNVLYLNPANRAEAIASIKEIASKGQDIHAIGFLFNTKVGQEDKELLGPLESTLGFLGGVGAGYDKVDIPYLNSIGAYYANSPNFVAEPCSMGAFVLLMQCVRHSYELDQWVRRGEWNHGSLPLTADPRDMTVGIVGMGSIGSRVATKCQAMGMKVIYYNRKPLPAEKEAGATWVSFEQLIKESDIISLHCPLKPETTHLLSTKEFAAMKDGVMIVNTSRGKVVDEEALVQALKSGKVARAGLDVFEQEPIVHPYLMTCDKVSLTPHCAGGTTRITREGCLEVLRNITDFLETGKPKSPVNTPTLKGSVNGATNGVSQ